MKFDVEYQRWPFFLKGRQPDVDRWYAEKGFPPNTTRGQLEDAGKMSATSDASIDALYVDCGLSPRNKEATRQKIWTDTMQAHKLAQYAATESPEKGEIVWWTLGQNFFMGKDTDLRPIRLDDSQLLMEVAQKADLDLQAVGDVLGGSSFEKQILHQVDQVHSLGIHAIPFLVIEIPQLVSDSWTSGKKSPYRKLHRGSGNRASFQAIFEELHRSCSKMEQSR